MFESTRDMSKGLKIENLRQQIAGFSVDADFKVDEGQRLALTGPSGSGKTTLVRMIAGLIPLTGQGGITLGGQDISHERPERRRIGVVFQEQALFPALNVLQNAIFGLRMHGRARAEAEAEGLKWLDQVGLADRALSDVTVLSGGERQRVAFVRALIWKPDLILLDEPFSALDAERRGRLRELLIELHGLSPAPLILVTHDEEDIRESAMGRISLRPGGDPNVRVFRLENR